MPYIWGLLCGTLNGLFGSGGGVVAVPMLEKEQIEAKKAHATSVCIIFILSIATAVFYYYDGKLDFGSALSYIPGGIVGAIVGAFILKKIDNSLLRRIFGIIILVSAVRLFLK